MILAASSAGHALARAGIIVDALLAAIALLAGDGRRRLAVAGALVLTPVLLAGELWKSTQVEHLRHHALVALAAALVALAVVVVLAVLLRRRPALLALLAVITLPFRFSVLAGGTGGILLALYVVVAAGALALVAWDQPPERPEAAAGGLERALAAFIVLYAVQAMYTPAPSLVKAVEDVCFFQVPFSLLFVLLRRINWTRELLARCATTVVLLALGFVAVALVEYASRRLIFNTALNSDQRYFRVNSLFYDPNIFGRFVALAMVLVTAVMMWERDRRRVLIAAVVLAVLWLGLLGSVSQSSMLALLAGLLVIAAARFSVRISAVATGVLVAAGVAFAIAASGRLHLNLSDTSAANNSTSGRASLVKQGFDLFVDRPLAGFGSGSFSCEYLRHTSSYGCAPSVPITSDSHTIPVTVAAEQGLLGLAAYVVLLVASLWRLAGGGVRRRVARVAALAAFVALVVHTWAYADFLEDPMTWTLLAVGTVLARE